MAAFILAVGLLGLGAMQIATTRGAAAAGARQTALGLAGAALEAAQCRRPPDPPAGPEETEREQRFDRDGRPAGARPAFFTVTVRRSALDSSPARTVRARVAWPEAGRPGRLERVRIVGD